MHWGPIASPVNPSAFFALRIATSVLKAQDLAIVVALPCELYC